MQLNQYVCLYAEQLIIEGSLVIRKFNFESFGFSYGKFSDISASGTVNNAGKRMEAFHISNQFDSFALTDCGLLQNIYGVKINGIPFENGGSPFCISGVN